MTDVLFKLIPQALYEPIAVGAVLGIMTALVFCWKKRTVWYWIIPISILFMLGWRAAIQIISNRYAIILIYPATIFTVYFCFKLEEICRYFFKFRHGRLVSRFIPWLFILGLSIAGIVKILHFNPNSDYLIKACEVYLADSKNNEHNYVYTYNVHTEARRIIYYSGFRKMSDVAIIGSIYEHGEVDILRNKIRTLRNAAGAHYFYTAHKKHEPYYTAEMVGVSEDEWTKLCGFYTSKRKNKEFVLYKYTPKCPNVKEWNGEIPAANPKNLLINGGFETAMSGKVLEARRKWFAEQGLAGYAADEFLPPAAWGIGVSKWNAKNPPIMTLSAQNPLSGKYSLFAETKHTTFNAGFSSPGIAGQNCKYSGFVRGEGETASQIWISPRYWDPVQKKTVILDNYFFFTEPGRTYHFSGNILKNEIQNAKSFYLYFTVKGSAVFDNIEVVP